MIQAFGHQQGPLNRTGQEQTSSVWKSKQSHFNGSFLPTEVRLCNDTILTPARGGAVLGVLKWTLEPRGDAAFSIHPGMWVLHKSLWPAQWVYTIQTMSGKYAPE